MTELQEVAGGPTFVEPRWPIALAVGFYLALMITLRIYEPDVDGACDDEADDRQGDAAAVEAARLNAEAGVRAEAAGEANQRADNYVLAVVLFASSLFFAGISTKLHSLRQREVLLAIGWTIFVGTAVWLATLPIMFSI